MTDTTFRSSISNQGTATAGLTTNFPAGCLVGETLIAVVVSFNSVGISQKAISTPAGWTHIPGGGLKGDFFYHVVQAGESDVTTVAFNTTVGTADAMALGICCYSNHNGQLLDSVSALGGISGFGFFDFDGINLSALAYWAEGGQVQIGTHVACIWNSRPDTTNPTTTLKTTYWTERENELLSWNDGSSNWRGRLTVYDIPFNPDVKQPGFNAQLASPTETVNTYRGGHFLVESSTSFSATIRRRVGPGNLELPQSRMLLTPFPNRVTVPMLGKTI